MLYIGRKSEADKIRQVTSPDLIFGWFNIQSFNTICGFYECPPDHVV